MQARYFRLMKTKTVCYVCDISNMIRCTINYCRTTIEFACLTRQTAVYLVHWFTVHSKMCHIFEWFPIYLSITRYDGETSAIKQAYSWGKTICYPKETAQCQLSKWYGVIPLCFVFLGEEGDEEEASCVNWHTQLHNHSFILGMVQGLCASPPQNWVTCVH